MKMKNYFILLITVLVGGLTFSACNNDDDYVRIPAAYVNFVNAYAGADQLGISLGRGSIRIDYGTYLQYQPVNAGTYNFNAGLPNTSVPIVDSTIILRDSTAYTSVVYGYQDTVSSILVEDKDAANFDASKAYIRFFNLSENTPAVKVNLIQNGTPTTVFNDRAVDTQSSAETNAAFTAIDPNAYTIQVTDLNDTQLALRDEAASLSAGKYYTILTRGINGNTQKPIVVGIFQH